jgi:prevent-host-death family protein
MKPIVTSKDIVPLNEFKTRASRLLRQLREGRRPLIITRNGKPAGVLITPEEFDRIRERDRFIEAVSTGLADSVAERVLDDHEMEERLDAELGPPE